jgi:hypothetical protein
VACEWRSTAVHLEKKIVINTINGQYFGFAIIMIGPGGLLLVVPHIFAVLVSVLWVGLKTKLECEN